MADTGNGATLTFSGGFAGTYQELGGCEQELVKVEDSHLGSTGPFKTYIPGDLAEPGDFEAETQFTPGATPLPALGTSPPETITVTYPGGATLAGTGFVTKRKSATLKNNELMLSNFTVQWDGKTGPTFAAAT